MDVEAREPECATTHDWVEEHADSLYRYAISRISDESVVEELIQETFLSAIRSIDLFQGDSSLGTWLISILRHKVVDHFRKAQREHKRVQSLGQRDLDPDELRSKRLKSWNKDPMTEAATSEFWDVFHSCLSQLPPILAEAFRTRELEQRSSQEICDEWSISSPTLAMRLYRARSNLRDCLDKHWFNPS